MDKLIEILAGKRIVTLMIVFFVAFAFFPSFFFIFVWKRELFCNLDLWKLSLLATSIGIILWIINFLFLNLMDNIYIKLTGKEEGILEMSNNEGRKYLSYFLMALMFNVFEVIILVLIKYKIPSITISELLTAIYAVIKIVCIVIISLEIIAHIINWKRKKSKKVSQ